MPYPLVRRPVTFVTSALLMLAAFCVGATAARAEFVVDIQDAQPSQTKAAMAYSNFSLSLAFPRDSSPKSLQLDLPKGQLGVLSAASICSPASFAADSCPSSSQIGSTSVVVKTALLGNITAPGSIYRINTKGTEVGRLGIIVRPPIGDKMQIEGLMRVRDDGSYGIRATVPEIAKKAKLSLLPGAPPIELDITVESMLMTMYGRIGGSGTAGFFFNPAECIPATTTVSSTAWDNSTATDTFAYTPTGCASVPFTPSVSFEPNPSPASAPAEFSVHVRNPFDGAAEKVQSPIRTTKIILPEGVQLTGATDSDGKLEACTDAQFSYANLTPASCPTGSQVGSVVMDSPLVGAVPGKVFLAQPQSGPNDIVRLFVVAELGPEADAVRVKLLVRVEVDPVTGVTTNTLENLPAQPVKSFDFIFRGGTSPATRQPRLCGTYAGAAEITPYASPTPLLRTADYVVGSNCPTPGVFRPTLAMTTSPTQAGAATTGVTTIDLPVTDEPMAKTRVSLPPGMLANLDGVPRCTKGQASAGACPIGSRIGSVTSKAGQSTVPGTFGGNVYLTEAPTDDALAGLFIDVPVQVGPIYLDDLQITASLILRPDYGVDVVSSIPETVRGLQLDQQQLKLTFDRANFLTNPPVCEGNSVSGAFESVLGTKQTVSSPLTVTGCEALEFDPQIAFSATPASASAASQLTTTVTMPPSTSGHPQAPAKRIAVTLPAGVSLSPSAGARGDLAGCSDAQFGLGSLGDPTCPSGSQVGVTTIVTPSVGQLSGKVYLGDPVPGHLARVMIDATSDLLGPNARVKLVGTIDVDEQTGQVSTAFEDLPPVGFTSFTLVMRGGDAPVLTMPDRCGTTQGTAVATPYSGGAVVTRTASLTIDQDCPDPAAFAPSLELGLSTSQAGADTALTTVVKVPSGSQALTALDLMMPKGLLGRLTAVPLCPLDQAAAGTCGDASLVGSVTAKAGVASAPFPVTGRVYMTAGSDDAIAGLAFVLPAKVGPIDLGQVVTLSKLRITGPDLQLRISAEGIPTQVKGIPLQIRELSIAIDKPGVALNASSCEARSANATFTGAGGATATGSAPYQATGCDRLDWQPSMQLDFTGPANELAVKGHPTVTTEITQKEGQGSLRTADVLLPAGLATDLKNVNARACVSVEAASKGECGATSQVGTAVINTSALPEPVDAAIFLVKVPGQVLPGLLLRVRDQISFDTLGVNKVDGATGRIRVTFDNTPDTPISKLALTFTGGADGLLQIGRDICTAGSTNASLTAHHGTQRAFTLPVRCNGKVASFGTATVVPASATLAVRPTGKKRGYTLTVKNTGGVRRVTFAMPKGFGYAKGASKRVTVKVTGGGTKKVKVTRSVKGRTLTVRVGAAKVTAVAITVPSKGATFTSSFAKSLRKKSGQKKFKPALTILDDAAKPIKVTPKATFAKK